MATFRRASAGAFWEIFSGRGVLSAAFSRRGWWVGPPIDVINDMQMDLLNVNFFNLVLGIILEADPAVQVATREGAVGPT